jgi:hypothetical protein
MANYQLKITREMPKPRRWSRPFEAAVEGSLSSAGLKASVEPGVVTGRYETATIEVTCDSEALNKLQHHLTRRGIQSMAEFSMKAGEVAEAVADLSALDQPVSSLKKALNSGSLDEILIDLLAAEENGNTRKTAALAIRERLAEV